MQKLLINRVDEPDSILLVGKEYPHNLTPFSIIKNQKIPFITHISKFVCNSLCRIFWCFFYFCLSKLDLIYRGENSSLRTIKRFIFEIAIITKGLRFSIYMFAL